jgi:uncharacterized protein YxjI
MEIKIQCGCGTKYKFDVEPVNGRMPVRVQCPNCASDGTTDANQQIAQIFPAATASSPPPPPPVRVALSGGLRLSGKADSASAESAGMTDMPGGADRALLERTTFFIKERVAMLKLTDTYDILDPATGRNIGIAREEPPVWAKWLRLVVKKHRMPTAVNIYEVEGQPPVLSIRRGFTFIRAKINVVAGDGRSLGYFKSKLISIGGGFHVYDHADQQVAEVKGNWKGWDFRFLNKSGREIGTVTKKWAGLGKELFTSADNYIISLTDLGGANSDASALLLAAGLAIDVVYKEND